jgi:protein arginine kinase activator
MTCDECGVNNAKIRLTKIVNGKMIEMNLCEQCAKKHSQFHGPFSLQNIMSGWLSDFHKQETIQKLQCEKCGMTYDEFKQSGKFGCSHCYGSFKKNLSPLIRSIHGHDSHRGKIPEKAGSELKQKKEIEKLKHQLSEAIETEAYEKAAEIRDKIKELERKFRG